MRAVEHLAGSMSRAVPAGTRLWVKSADEAVVWERAEVLSQAGSVLALQRAAPAGGAPTEDSLDLDSPTRTSATTRRRRARACPT